MFKNVVLEKMFCIKKEKNQMHKNNKKRVTFLATVQSRRFPTPEVCQRSRSLEKLPEPERDVQVKETVDSRQLEEAYLVEEVSHLDAACPVCGGLCPRYCGARSPDLCLLFRLLILHTFINRDTEI